MSVASTGSKVSTHGHTFKRKAHSSILFTITCSIRHNTNYFNDITIHIYIYLSIPPIHVFRTQFPYFIGICLPQTDVSSLQNPGSPWKQQKPEIIYNSKPFLPKHTSKTSRSQQLNKKPQFNFIYFLLSQPTPIWETSLASWRAHTHTAGGKAAGRPNPPKRPSNEQN